MDLGQIIFRIMGLVGIGIVLAMGTIFLLLVVSLNGGFYYVSFIIVVAVVIFIVATLMMFQFFTTKKRKQAVAVLAVITILLAFITPFKEIYKNQIPTVDAEVDIYQYMPFTEGNNVTKIDHEASIQLQEPLPIIDGATAFYPLYASFTEAIYPKKDYQPYESKVMVNKTPAAYKNLIDGQVDLIFALAPSEQQINYAKVMGVELKLTPIGKEAFVFFVNAKNNIDGLTLDQIKDVYAGTITNWSEVGGKDEDIRAFQRPQDSGSQTALQNLMGDKPIMEAPTENIAQGMGGIIEEVSKYRNYKNAIGYTFRYYSNEMVKNDEIKLLEVDGVAPTVEMIRSEAYPITNEFYIVTTQNSNPQVQQIIDWVTSTEGQLLLEKAGYVPITSPTTP
ncbi:PstS family phosphate ABC transporter substrate-binding protein [Solibacillus daqui]|uniref:PstS family phosphate ABC transporter substrate-binding protein n=1 Tax=Solibacillus daqui TaxID=2912187 RepID=UPI002366E43A|nr:substrate-binding domain-containing protein [Solibacillus daqui]